MPRPKELGETVVASFCLEKSLYEAIKQVAAALGVSASALAREAFSNHIKELATKLGLQVVFDDPPTDNANTKREDPRRRFYELKVMRFDNWIRDLEQRVNGIEEALRRLPLASGTFSSLLQEQVRYIDARLEKVFDSYYRLEALAERLVNADVLDLERVNRIIALKQRLDTLNNEIWKIKQQFTR